MTVRLTPSGPALPPPTLDERHILGPNRPAKSLIHQWVMQLTPPRYFPLKNEPSRWANVLGSSARRRTSPKLKRRVLVMPQRYRRRALSEVLGRELINAQP